LSAPLSRRCYERRTEANSWEEIWEAGPYFDRISELLESARHYAVFVGWQIDSRIPLHRPSGPSGHPLANETLKQKILRLCGEKPHFQIYFLMWDHASLYIVEREWWQTRVWEDIHPRVHFVFDNRHPFGGSHHEKICIIDGKVAFCGGIDLCGERWDTPEHLYSDPRRSLDWKKERHGPYHDMAVQLTGPVCQMILEHVRRRWSTLSTIPLPETDASPALGDRIRGHRVYLSRTLVNNSNGHREPIVREIEFLFRELVRSAEHQIVIEGQYYWSRELNDVLITKIRQMAGKEFRLILILSELKMSKSFTRNMAGHQLRLLSQLQAAALDSGIKLIMGAPYVRAEKSAVDQRPLRPVYVHSKILIIDDRYLSIGSANLAARAMRVDTELGVTLEATTAAEKSHIRGVTQTIMRHWGMNEDSSRRDVFIRSFKPALELSHMREIKWRAPWRPFFDPEMPWLRRIKHRLRRTIGSPHSLRWSVILWLPVWTFTLALATIFVTDFPAETSARIVFLTLTAGLSSVAVIPTPFFALTAIATAEFGGNTALPIAIIAVWNATLIRYAMERGFPSDGLKSEASNDALERRLGRRTIRSILLAAADPRIGLQRKIASFGIFCIPFPWLLICITIVWPAVLGLMVALTEIGLGWVRTAT